MMKRDKNETYSDYNETEIKQKKDKKETYSDYNEIEINQQEKKKRDKNEIPIETCFDYYDTEIKQQKKKRDKDEVSTNIHSRYNETDLKQHKKKKEKAEDVVSCETYFDYHETEIEQNKKKMKEKLDFSAEINAGYDNGEFEQHTKERKNKEKNIELENSLHWESQHEMSTDKNMHFSSDTHQSLFVEPEVNFGYQHKDEKKHKKENNFKAMVMFSTDKEAQIQPQKQKKDKISAHVSEADISNGTEICIGHKSKSKHKKGKENSNVPEQFSISSCLSEDKKKSKHHISAVEANKDCETGINSLYNYGKKSKKKRLNVSEGFAKIIPQKLKKRKIHTDINEAYTTQYDVTSEAFSKCKKPVNAIDENSIDLEIAEIFRTCKSRMEDNVLNSNFKAEIDELHKKSHLDNDRVYHTELNTQNIHSGVNAFESVPDANLSKKQKKKLKKGINNNAHSFVDFSAINFISDTRKSTEIDISNALYNKDISYVPVVLHNNSKEGNCTASSNTNNTCELPYPAHRKQQLQNSALSASEFNHHNSYHSDHQIIANENEIANNIDCTDKLSEEYAEKDVENLAETVLLNTYFSSDLDCNEDPVDFEIPPLHQFETVYPLSEKQKLDLQVLDVCIKTGNFTATEDGIIQRNFEDFVKQYNVSDPYSLFGIGRYRKDTQLMKFLKAKHFYVRIANELNNRTLNSIYKRARIILNPLKKTGRLTKNEIGNLKSLHISFHKKWQKIGDSLGSTAERCAESFRWHEKNVAKGPFTKEEKTQLIEAIKKVSGNSDLSSKSVRGINWEVVASHVPSRNGSQCRMYWGHNLAWAPGSARNKWNRECYERLIKILKKQNPSNIDWNVIYESFQDFAPSEMYVQKRWHYLRSQVCDYSNKSYQEILNALCDKYLIYDDDH